MANIRTLQDLQPDDSFVYTQQTSFEAPLQRQRCIDMFFPGFRWVSFVLWISVIQIIVYIVSLCLGSYRLQPDSSVLRMMGDLYWPPIRDDWEIWRLVTSLFLHASAMHILVNVFFQMRMGFPLEFQYGNTKIAVLYMTSGILGNCIALLLSVPWDPFHASVGASVSGFGLIGFLIGELAFDWNSIQHKDRVIFNLVAWVVMAVLMSVAPGSLIDWRGHLGGFIVGATLVYPIRQWAASSPSARNPHLMPLR